MKKPARTTARKPTRRQMSSSTKRSKPDSPTAIGKIIRSLGGLGGGALGGMIGLPGAGSAIGTSLGASLSKWLGAGDYTLKQNSLVSNFRSNGQIPSMHRNGQSVVVRHKEYVADVNSSTAFAVFNSYPLNPGLSGSFPWLSGIAQQYQEYTWKGVVYEFVSTSGDVVASSNTALGTVIMATQYRATSTPFSNKQTMLNEYFSSDGKPSISFCHPIECDPKENPYNVQYVRGGPVPTGEDAKTYDLGIFSIATEGMQAAGVDIGELWVSYEVELRKPAVTNPQELFSPYAHYTSSSGVTALAIFGTSITAVGTDFIGLTVTGNKITFPVGLYGEFMITYGARSATAADLSSWISGGTFVNCSFPEIVQGGSNGNGLASVYTVGTGRACASALCNIVDPTIPASITFWAGGILVGATGMDLIITQTRLGSV